MTILRSTIRGAVRAAPFAFLFFGLRRSNRQHVQRFELTRAAIHELGAHRQSTARRTEDVAAVVATISDGLCGVQGRLDDIARAAATA